MPFSNVIEGDQKIVKHVIVWKLKVELSEEKKQAVKTEIKEGLESLKGKIPGLLSIEVYTQGLSSSTADLMLDSEFESVEALKGYYPEHVACKMMSGSKLPKPFKIVLIVSELYNEVANKLMDFH